MNEVNKLFRFSHKVTAAVAESLLWNVSVHQNAADRKSLGAFPPAHSASADPKQISYA